jgi:citrate lyase subunit beta/citryl-CoA lyase
MRPRRSVLSMPADRPRFHEKAKAIASDEVIFDLEDSVLPGNKVQARSQMVASLRQLRFGLRIVA